MGGSSGLLELYRSDEPTVDVVAIHGLNGDRVKTWTTNSGACWLKDPNLLPSHLRTSRILTYGYNATVAALFDKTSSDRILQHAQTLVSELVADRQLESASRRPIIFICHSLGGIIVKRALAYSASRTGRLIEHLHSIHVSTFGIMFLGTPHDGGNKVQLASTCRRMVATVVPSKVVDSEGQLLDALQAGSEVLQNITDGFVPLMKNYRIYFFWEQEKTSMRAFNDYVVRESSAAPIVDNTERAGLPYDHTHMCKFENRSSPGYRLLVAALIRYGTEAPEIINHRWRHAEKMLASKRLQEAEEILA